MYEKNYLVCIIAASIGVIVGSGVGRMFQLTDVAFYVALIGVACVELVLCFFMGNGDKETKKNTH